MSRYSEAEIRGIFDSPRIYVRDIDWRGGQALCLPMNRESYSRSAFLDERTVSADGSAAAPIPVKALLDAWRAEPPAPRPIAFVAHMALSGSTFLARALDLPGRCLPYKEPYLMHRLAGAWRTGGQRRIQAGLPYDEPSVLELTLALMQRSFVPSEKPLVKLTDSGTSLLPAALRARPGSRVLLLYQGLRRYLATMLKRPERRRHARDMIERSALDLAAAGKPDLALATDASDGRCAAYVWLGLMYPYLRLTAAGPSRVRSLDAATLLDEPLGAAAAAGRFLRLGIGRQAIVTRLGAGVLETDAKDPDARFDRDRRKAELEDALARHRDEIDDAMAWVREITRDDPPPDELPGGLLVR